MASTSASVAQKSFKYDVFLSFRGEDTRKNFVDHLYHALHQKGIITYKDDEKIQKGERISEQLIRSIKDSRFHIIVFSKNYASSSWCLDELVQIMDCQKTMEQTAYPIFFDVEPTEVRHQSGAFGKAFAEHETGSRSFVLPLDYLCSTLAFCFLSKCFGILIFKYKVDSESWLGLVGLVAILQRVKISQTGQLRLQLLSLILTAKKKGLSYASPAGPLEAHHMKVIDLITPPFISGPVTSLMPFEPTIKSGNQVNEKLVGMETRVKRVISSLQSVSDDVRMIGIKGMGGGGKTTLARAIFDLISIWFEGKSFVENVREVSKGSLSGLKEIS
ncbi:TMV resistance protein N-like [Bidens hawaiensis]|uniref:TMV resistance protein N-like n=1 Tax=Bidens hawaiensis TaxID=980011 RepID=UPI00404B1119